MQPVNMNLAKANKQRTKLIAKCQRLVPAGVTARHAFLTLCTRDPRAPQPDPGRVLCVADDALYVLRTSGTRPKQVVARLARQVLGPLKEVPIDGTMWAVFLLGDDLHWIGNGEAIEVLLANRLMSNGAVKELQVGNQIHSIG
jgi:hypothetical protein